MSDIREALFALVDATLRPFQVGPKRGPSDAVGAIADAILSKFDVTERGEGGQPGECTARHPGTRLQCVLKSGHRGVHTFAIAAHPPITLPSVEDVARALFERAVKAGDAIPHRSVFEADAHAVLALLPGRTEAEVRQDEAERIAAWVTADEPSDTLVLLADALRRGDHRG